MTDIASRAVLSVCPTGPGGGGGEGKRKFVYLKWASHFWVYSKSYLYPEDNFLVLGVGGVWPCGGGVSQITPPPPRWLSTSHPSTRQSHSEGEY